MTTPRQATDAFVRKALAKAAPILGQLRLLPEFILVGAQKAGTTSLYALLVQHPQILAAKRKELHFFDIHYEQGQAWYRNQFRFKHEALLAELKSGQQVVTGEASPYYLYYPHAAARIAQHCPHAKILVMLREPIARAISHYHFNVRRGVEQRTFNDAVAFELAHLPHEHRRVAADPTYISKVHQNCSYLARGEYAEQVARYFELFGRGNVHVGFSETFFRNPTEYAESVVDFLALRPAALPDVGAKNAGAYDDSLSLVMRSQLEAYYERPNRELQCLLDQPIPWMS